MRHARCPAPELGELFAGAIRQASDDGGFREMPIATGILDLADAGQYRGNFVRVCCNPATYRRKGPSAVIRRQPVSRSAGFQLHARPRSCASRQLRSSITIESQDVDFALVIAGDLDSARQLFSEARPAGAGEAFSGWTSVAHGEEPRLNAFITEQVGVWQNIYFATRMKNPG